MNNETMIYNLTVFVFVSTREIMESTRHAEAMGALYIYFDSIERDKFVHNLSTYYRAN